MKSDITAMARWFLMVSSVFVIGGGPVMVFSVLSESQMAEAQLIIQKSKSETKKTVKGRKGRSPAIIREIKVLGKDNRVISPDHYERLDKQLKDLARNTSVYDINQLREILERLNPATLEKIDREKEAMREVAKQRQVQPPDILPPESGCDVSRPILTHDFTDFSKIREITPPGSPAGEKDVAKGHFWIWTGGERVPVFLPIGATLESVTSGPAAVDNPTIHHTLNFRVKDSCSFKLRFAHITEPDGSLVIGATYPAGTLIAHTIGNIPSGNWDVGFYDVANLGPLAAIRAYGLHAHGLCLVDYYIPEKQAAYRARLIGPQLVCSF